MHHTQPPGYSIERILPDITEGEIVIHQGVIRRPNGRQKVLRWRDDGSPICGARSSKHDTRCLNSPIRGNVRCRMHGGKSTGPRKYLETRLPNKILERAAQLRHDPETMSGKGDLAVAAAQVERILANGAAIEERFAELCRTWDLLENASAEADGDAVEKLMNRLRDQFRSAKKRSVDPGELREWLDLRRKMLETERKTLSGDAITVDDVRLLMMRIMRAIEAHVPDKSVIRNIATEVGLLKQNVIDVESEVRDVGKCSDRHA